MQVTLGMRVSQRKICRMYVLSHSYTVVKLLMQFRTVFEDEESVTLFAGDKNILFNVQNVVLT